jgi:hypothetical protein
VNEAIIALEASLAPLARLEHNDVLRAETWAELANALGDANRELARARALAEQARQLFERTNRAENAASLGQWLKRHPLDP